MVEPLPVASSPGLSRHSLERFGRSALDVFAGRLALLHLGVAALSTPLALSAPPTASARALVAAGSLVLLFVACACVARAAFARHAPAAWTLPLAALAAGTSAAVAATSRAGLLDLGRSAELTSLLIAGVCGGLGLCRGPGPAVVTAGLLVAAHLAVHPQASVSPSSFAFLGGVTYLVGGVLVRWAADRGFASTERALAGAEQAETERELATQRWRVGRREARQLHDTVLATLTLLAHGGAGVDLAGLRGYCARDVDVLAARPGQESAGAVQPTAPVDGTSARRASPGDIAPGAPGDIAPGDIAPDDGRPGDVVLSEVVLGDLLLGDAVEALSRDADALRIRLQVHASPDSLGVRLRPEVADSLLDAATEALRNVRRHAGVDTADLMLTAGADRLSLVLSDEGVGFDPGSAGAARAGSLGLSTARDRVDHVGGSLAVWSRPGTGTSVVISVPHTTGPRAWSTS